MTTQTLKLSEIKRNWHLIDLKGQVLGRAATQIAHLLMGKQKPTYSPMLDMGDYVVVINTEDLKFTGKKGTDKLYQRHSGWPGGFRELSLNELMAKDSRKVILSAVKGMLPDNKLKSHRLARLKLFKTAEHPYQTELAK
jgi:large subunit ribosomal protein L13